MLGCGASDHAAAYDEVGATPLVRRLPGISPHTRHTDMVEWILRIIIIGLGISAVEDATKGERRLGCCSLSCLGCLGIIAFWFVAGMIGQYI